MHTVNNSQSNVNPEKEYFYISKMLSLVLRHNPGSIGISLDENGWTEVKKLIQQMNKNGFNLTREMLVEIAETNEKQQFAFNPAKTKIRFGAGQPVHNEPGFPSKTPPKILYYGASTQHLEAIFADGLLKRSKNFVALCTTPEAAIEGHKRGKPVVLIIESGKMHKDGIKFYVNEESAFITDHVPAKYIKLHNELIK